MLSLLENCNKNVIVAGFGRPNVYSDVGGILVHDACDRAYPGMHLQALKVWQAIQAQDHTKYKARQRVCNPCMRSFHAQCIRNHQPTPGFHCQ
jgi:hypothetical protein